MQAATLELLEKEFTPAQARVLAQVIEVEVEAREKSLRPWMMDTFSTKQDLAEAKYDLIKTSLGILVIGLTAIYFMLQNLRP
jgi:hypothetical protein